MFRMIDEFLLILAKKAEKNHPLLETSIKVWFLLIFANISGYLWGI